jgi:copper chaperone CopZ
VSTDKPVVIYGASGYTGRLVAEYLREFNLPFVAAGRDAKRVAEAIENVPGINTIEYDVVEVEHTVEALTELFTGARVICNTVGPFASYGDEVAQAALAAGCHYVDTTGEQNWTLHAKETYGQKFADEDLLLAPSTSYMHVVSDIAANVVLETEGIDSLEILCLFSGTPTFASTQSIFTILAADHFYLEQDKLVQWPGAAAYKVHVPGQHEIFTALPWGGSAHPIWWQDDPRVANARALSGVFDQTLMNGVAAMAQHFEENIKPLPPEEQKKALAEQASGVQGGMPPRENRRIHRTLDSVIGRGPNKLVHCVIHGNATYLQTGAIQAYAARQLIVAGPRRVGFASACQAFGHRDILGMLQGFGFVGDPLVTGHVQ